MNREVKFNAVRVGEITVNLLADPKEVRVKAAFVDTERGDTYGWSMRSGWSEQTEQKFRAFIGALEAELEGVVFANEGGVRVEPGRIASPPVGGLGEHLGEPVPQG